MLLGNASHPVYTSDPNLLWKESCSQHTVLVSILDPSLEFLSLEGWETRTQTFPFGLSQNCPWRGPGDDLGDERPQRLSVLGWGTRKGMIFKQVQKCWKHLRESSTGWGTHGVTPLSKTKGSSEDHRHLQQGEIRGICRLGSLPLRRQRWRGKGATSCS